MSNTQPTLYTLLLLKSNEHYPVPNKSYVKIKLSDVIRQLPSINIERDNDKIIVHQYEGFNADDNVYAVLKVIDQEVETKSVKMILNVPNYGTIKIDADECNLVKPYVGSHVPYIYEKNVLVEHDKKFASELSNDIRTVAFKLIRELKPLEYSLFDSKVICEYATLIDYANYVDNKKTKSDVDSQSSVYDDQYDNQDVNQNEEIFVNIDMLYDDLQYTFTREQLQMYNTAVCSTLLACVDNYVKLDKNDSKTIIDDFVHSYQLLDLSKIFKSIEFQTILVHKLNNEK